jgi:mRNA-degrading endonuclease RelE of RelBE toxin-antitoxin system
MKVDVRVTESFKRASRSLIRRYRSFLDDLLSLEEELMAEPRMGTSLGGNFYKVRLKIASKGKGKSGGARVTTFVLADETEEERKNDMIVVNLLTVHDKSDQGDISDAELKKLVAALKSS